MAIEVECAEFVTFVIDLKNGHIRNLRASGGNQCPVTTEMNDVTAMAALSEYHDRLYKKKYIQISSDSISDDQKVYTYQLVRKESTI